MKTWLKNKIIFILYVYRRDWSWRPWGVCGMQSRALQIRKTVKKATKIHENPYNTLSIGIPIQMDIVYFDDFHFRKKNCTWCSLSEHSSELTKPIWIILGALKPRRSSVFCESKIIKNEWLTAKCQHETCARKKVHFFAELTKNCTQFYEISLN